MSISLPRLLTFNVEYLGDPRSQVVKTFPWACHKGYAMVSNLPQFDVELLAYQDDNDFMAGGFRDRDSR